MKLLIPSLFILLPVKESADRQATVDEPNMGAMWHWNDLTVIADHAGQGFDRLERAKPRMKAWLGMNRYTCDRSTIGYIQNKRLYLSDGSAVHETYKSGLVLYTCHRQKLGDIQPVRLTHWSKDEER